MRKRTSRIYPDGITECNEVYAPFSDGWQYCDAIYKCDENGVMTCLWKKLAEETYIGVFQSVKWYVTWKNKLYAFAKVYKGGTEVVAHEGDYLEYDYQTGKWYVVKELGKMPRIDDDMRMTEQGVFSHYSYVGKFLSLTGEEYNLPTEEIEFYANAGRNVEQCVFTNKGIFHYDGLHEYISNDILIEADYKGSLSVQASVYNSDDGYIYSLASPIIDGLVYSEKMRMLRIDLGDSVITSKVIASYDSINGVYPYYEQGRFFTNGETIYPLGGVRTSDTKTQNVVYEKNSYVPKFTTEYNLVAVSPDEKLFAFYIWKNYNYYVKVGLSGDEILVPAKAYGSSMDLSLFHFVEDLNYKGTDENDKKYDLYYFTTKLTGTNPGDINTGMIYER